MNTFQKYIWLIELLRRRQRLTLEEIGNYWRESELNVDNEKLNDRTFHRWRDNISDILGIEIDCDLSGGYDYFIKNLDELKEGSAKAWLVDSMAVSNIIEQYRSLADRIFIDNIPSSTWLKTILDAMKGQRQLRIVYHPFRREQLEPELIEPHCIRCFERRWYAVVRYVERDAVRVIALDRIVSLEPTDERFALPPDFDAGDYFRYDYGIGIGFDEEVQVILLRVNAIQRPYTDSLPLHFSQKEVEHTDDYSIYELFMRPTKDLARALLPYGRNIEVIKPLSLRKMVAEMARATLANNPMPSEEELENEKTKKHR